MRRKRFLKPGDIVVQHNNEGIWFITAVPDPDYWSGPCLKAVCIKSGVSTYETGEDCPFTIKPLDEGVEIIGHVDDYDAAVAACALGAFDFVKGS